MNPQQYPFQPGQPGQPGQTGQPGQPQPGYGSPPPHAGYPAQPAAQPAPGATFGPQPGQPAPQQPGVPGPAPGGSNGYNPYAFPGELDRPKRKGPNKVIIIAVVVIALVVIVGVIVASLGGSDSGTTPATETGTTKNTTSNAGNDIVPRSDNVLDLSKRIETRDTLKAQTLKAKTKEQVNLSSGFSFMVTKTEDYTSTNPSTKPAANKKFVVVTTVIGNRKQTGNLSVSYLDFRLRDESNQLLAGNVATNEIINNPISSPTEIKPGEQLTGKIVYEVDSDDKNWVFKHTETYQKTTDDTTFTVEGEITVQLADAAPINTTGDSGSTTTNGRNSNTPATPPATTTTP